jgi:signal transduction histidine kinase
MFIIPVFNLRAQHKVTFVLTENTRLKHDSIFLSGTFNNWDATVNKNYLLKPYEKNAKTITISLPEGDIQYKYHRGNWDKVEKTFSGDEVPNRVVKIVSDTMLEDNVVSWWDEFFPDKWNAISNDAEDSTLLFNYSSLANVYAFYAEHYNVDSAIHYASKGKLIFDKIKSTEKYKDWFEDETKIYFLTNIQEINASIFHTSGNYPKSLEIRLDNLLLAENSTDAYRKSDVLRSMATLYASMKDYNGMLNYGMKMDSLLNNLDKKHTWYAYYNYMANYIIASAYFKLNKPVEALDYVKKLAGIRMNLTPELYDLRTKLLSGDVYSLLNDRDAAMKNYDDILMEVPQMINHFKALAWLGKAKIFQKQAQTDSALNYARKAYAFFKTNNIDALISGGWGENSNYYLSEISPLLAGLFYKSGHPDSAYNYLQLYVSLRDTFFNIEKNNQFQAVILNENSRRQKDAMEKNYLQKEFKSQLKMYALIFCILLFIFLALIQYRNIKQKQKTNSILESTLKNLKSTQSKLIQSEKMASLGELTAGIAHEIQNPLNFVNNFSEVNKELVDEASQEIGKGNLEEVKSILNDIKDNSEKINHHGKRADGIVKGMLQHSQKSTGKKELTDINKLADEYLRLAYHGLRAKDKSFNATMKTDFDETIASINIIPQDIGRVMLNLFNNAFYAVAEKKKGQDESFDPIVSVSTKKMGDTILIGVKDNGNGIPQKIVDKIFQPFFTTKPTGQGTGLGLSLSYDIVKAHGGEIKVETSEVDGAQFIITLPL